MTLAVGADLDAGNFRLVAGDTVVVAKAVDLAEAAHLPVSLPAPVPVPVRMCVLGDVPSSVDPALLPALMLDLVAWTSIVYVGALIGAVPSRLDGRAVDDDDAGIGGECCLLRDFDSVVGADGRTFGGRPRRFVGASLVVDGSGGAPQSPGGRVVVGVDISAVEQSPLAALVIFSKVGAAVTGVIGDGGGTPHPGRTAIVVVSGVLDGRHAVGGGIAAVDRFAAAVTGVMGDGGGSPQRALVARLGAAPADGDTAVAGPLVLPMFVTL